MVSGAQFLTHLRGWSMFRLILIGLLLAAFALIVSESVGAADSIEPVALQFENLASIQGSAPWDWWQARSA